MIFSADTLERDTKAEEAIKYDDADDAITLKVTDEMNKETGRLLRGSRMFTDGKYFYVISTRKYIRPKNAEEDHEDKPMATVLESFDPADNFKHVKSVTLTKNENGDHWISKAYKAKTETYDVDFIQQSYIATNGQQLIWKTPSNHPKLFCMLTGIKLSHTSSQKPGMEFIAKKSDKKNGFFYDNKTGGWFKIEEKQKDYDTDKCYKINDFKWNALGKVASSDAS
jgi:hypothetical protein